MIEHAVGRRVPRERSRRLARGLLVPTLVAILLRSSLALIAPTAPAWDGTIYERAGEQIADGRGYVRAAMQPEEPDEETAFYPVGMPAVLAFLRAVGLGRAGDLGLQCLAGAAIVPLAGLLGRRVGGARIGRRAAWLVALWPGGVLLSDTWFTEPLFTLLVAVAATRIAFARSQHRWSALAQAAIVLAIAAYLRPTSLAVLGMLALGLGFAQRGHRPRAVATSLAIVGIITVVVLAPWTFRNARALGGLTLVSTNGGANLLLGTIGEGYYGEIPPELDCPGVTHEIERDRCHRAHAIDRITASPFSFVGRALVKVTNTFGSESAAAYAWGASLETDEATRERWTLWALAACRLFWLVLLALAIVGAIRFGARLTTLRVAVLAPIVGIAILHALVLGGDRYHAPAVPMLAALAALGWDVARGMTNARA